MEIQDSIEKFQESLHEGLEEQDDKENEIYPIKDIKIEKKSFSVYEVNRRIIKNDFILTPEFQRNQRWNNKQKSELIESILMGIPIPVIYAYQTGDGKLEIADGKQRLGCLNEFLEGKLILKGLKILTDCNGKKFEQLQAQEKTRIEDYQIDMYIISPQTPEKIKYDIFDRVNRGGTKINNQEMRNALYNGTCTKIINKMSDYEAFKEATGNPNSKNMKDRYLNLRFLSLYLCITKKIDIELFTPMDDFLAKAMKTINKKAEQDFESFLQNYEEIMKFIATNYKDDLFRFKTKDIHKTNKRQLSMALFEALTSAFMYAKENNKPYPLKEQIDIFKQELDKPEKITYGIDSKENIEFRINKALELIK
ncbi:DUF262 domain-containing protein [Campylobacter jejuni]|nr:DUF262 domain-containing protein [Campylobacter jejuni]EAJ6074194.1 DUF262 domain-containing protein [Campylobacter coli]